MSDKTPSSPGIQPDRIDPHSIASVTEWAKKLDVTENQIIDAVAAVGELGSEVELHLKGTRSTTNSERVDEVNGS